MKDIDKLFTESYNIAYKNVIELKKSVKDPVLKKKIIDLHP